jgi:DNA polymerase III alpha subunit (gram-positive type)
VRTAPDYREQYQKIMDILNTENAILVAHSADSDLRFLYLQNERFGMENFSGHVFDTLSMAIKHSPELNNHSVIELCKTWGIEHTIEHEALSDAYSCIDFIRHISDADGITPLEVFERYKEGSYIDSEDV